MHVVQLLRPLLAAPNVEIVEPPLPETAMSCVRDVLPQTELLRGIARANFSAQAARDPLFQHLNHDRQISLLRLAQQQMNVFRHDDVADHRELISRAHFVQND